MFDVELIENFYNSLESKISRTKQFLNRPLTLTEKILYSHIDSEISDFHRGRNYMLRGRSQFRIT